MTFRNTRKNFCGLCCLLVASTPALAPAQTPVTTTTGGTKGTIPMFSTGTNIENSKLYYNATGLGIGRFPSQMLDVNGNSVFRGYMQVSRTADATASTGTNSYPIQFNLQVYDSSRALALNPFFNFQAEPTGNNTASTGGTLNLLYFGGVGAPTAAETGLYFNKNGVIHFAPAQTFPITTGAQGPTGPQGPAGPAGPSGPTGPKGAAAPQIWTSTTLLQPLVSDVAQFGAVMGIYDAASGSDYYGQSRRSLIFPNACTASNFKMNVGYESLTFPFLLEADLLVNSSTVMSCSAGYDTGYGFSCVSSGTYAVPAGAQVVLQFTHTGTNPSNVFPQVTFACQ